VTTVNLLPADAASFRWQAINLSNKAAKLFASFDFVNAPYAAQAAWRAAANYRDIALALAPAPRSWSGGRRRQAPPPARRWQLAEASLGEPSLSLYDLGRFDGRRPGKR